MTKRSELKATVLSLPDNDPLAFERLALEIFQFQYQNNLVYQKYVDLLKIQPNQIDRIEKIPFLPISFFKNHTVISGEIEPQVIFESSGTTGTETSKHFVSDLPYYEAMSKKIFEQFYGSLTDYHIFALLPSYLERQNSSLVYMLQNFIYYSYGNSGGFYLNNVNEMMLKIIHSDPSRKILLVGVTFALLDLAENERYAEILRSVSDRLIVMETGGMKGKRPEIVREELHDILEKAFGVNEIHSEYGMTELLSQGYSKGKGWFQLPAHMKILLREINDPFSLLPHFGIGDSNVKYRGKSGGINVIDMANIDTISFIETKDLGRYSDDYKQFSVLGRFDDAELRGCNLMTLQ